MCAWRTVTQLASTLKIMIAHALDVIQLVGSVLVLIMMNASIARTDSYERVTMFVILNAILRIL